MSKSKRWALAIAAVVAILFGIGATAYAATGTVANSGNVSVTDVWTYEYVQFAPGTRAVSVDCPIGMKVVTGYGIQVWALTGDANDEQGSATDSDTWSVTFSNGGSQSVNSYLQVHATCV